MLFWSLFFVLAQCSSAYYYYYRQPTNNYYSSGGLQNYLQQYYGGVNTVGLERCDVTTLALITNYFQRLVPSLCPSLVSSCATIQQYIRNGESCQIRYRASLISQMCCQGTTEPDTTTAKPTTTTTTTTSSSTTQTCGISTINPARSFEVTNRAFTTLKIVGGSTANQCEYPWMAYLEIGDYLCGGTIIDETHILTAAHCLKGFDKSDVRVTVGEHDTRTTTGDEQIFTASEVNVHENYNSDTFENDIALITLNSPITYGSCAQPACLPSAGQSWTKGTDCVTAGWGVTQENDQSLPSTLQEVTVPYYSSADCLKDFTGYSSQDVFSSTICAGFPEGKKDACQGDSGGPLMCPSDGTWVVAGVVSTGYGCARQDYPGLYTNVASYTDWIERTK